MSSSSFKVQDPVTVHRESSTTTPNKSPSSSSPSPTTLDGVVAYVGPVEFNPDPDWIGIRLTGTSVTFGKNDGTVQGKRYFTAPRHGGLFVKAAAVTKKTNLTRLEELRLRRELKSTGTSSGSTSNAASTSASASFRTSPTPAAAATIAASTRKTGIPKTPGTRTTSKLSSSLITPKKKTPISSFSKSKSPLPAATTTTTRATTTSTPTRITAATTGTGTTAATTTTASSSTITRLEEIRKRRAQLQQKDSSSTSTSSSNTAATTATTTLTSTKSSSSLSTTTTTATGEEVTTTIPSSTALGVNEDAAVPQIQELQSKVKQMQQELVAAKDENKHQAQQIRTLQHELQQNLVTTEPTPGTTAATEDDAAAAAADIVQLQARLEDTEHRFEDYQQHTKRQMDVLQTQYQQTEVALVAANTEITGLTHELSQQQERQTQAKNAPQDSATIHARTSDAVHYKERAKLLADVASLQRRVEHLGREKQELEHTVEDLVLDKEQLLEEKEMNEDRVEELKLDTETAQMEVEELKLELEDTRHRLEIVNRTNAVSAASKTTMGTAKVGGGSATAAGGSGPSMDGGDHGGSGGTATEEEEEHEQTQADIAHNLSIQNGRLREALIRLREQSSVEKMELTRQVRSMEKHGDDTKAVQIALEKVREQNATLEEQISDLKDMVEQGSAYETMVEDLSDRVLSFEEELTISYQTIRELEEAADITAEMEEVQTDELKQINRDMEDRETIIRNLEDAIKMYVPSYGCFGVRFCSFLVVCVMDLIVNPKTCSLPLPFSGIISPR